MDKLTAPVPNIGRKTGFTFAAEISNWYHFAVAQLRMDTGNKLCSFSRVLQRFTCCRVSGLTLYTLLCFHSG
jgi:hypothetical protein